MKKVLAILMALSMTFIACADDGLFGECNCDDEMEEVIADHGDPEEINKYDSEDYHSWTFWYWCKGFSVTFTWGTYVDECCEVSTYTFSPICT